MSAPLTNTEDLVRGFETFFRTLFQTEEPETEPEPEAAGNLFGCSLQCRECPDRDTCTYIPF